MTEKNNMEILQEIRQKRKDELDSIKDTSTFVIKVEDLGRGKQTQKEIYRLIEEKYISNGDSEPQKMVQEMFYEYDKRPILVGVRNPQTQGKIVPIGFDGDKQKEWDIEKGDIEQCLEERERQVKVLAKVLGIDPQDLENLSEIELSKKIDEKQSENDQDLKKDKKDEPQEISEEEAKKLGMTGMNEIKLNSRIDTKGTTLGQILNLDGYTKIMVVHSYRLAELTNSEGEKGKVSRMSFGLIAQKADGTFETIQETKLRPYRGENRRVTEINDKENVETKNEECMFEVPGTNKRLVISQKDPYGIPDVYLSQNTRGNDGNMAQKLQDKYDGTERQDVEVRALFNANRGLNQADKSVKEVKEHEDAGCKDIDIDEADGREDTGHIDFNPDSPEQQKVIEEIMQRGKVSREEAENKLEKVLREAEERKEDINLESATDSAVAEIENDFRGIDQNKR